MKQLPFALLQPIHSEPNSVDIWTIEDLTDLSIIWKGFDFSDKDEVMAIDLETKGNRCDKLDSYPVMVGLTDKRGSICIDLRSSHPDTWKVLLDGLFHSRVPLIAHNLNYDAGFIFRDYNCVTPGREVLELSKGKWHNYRACTFGMYKHLASEGWLGQKWGLAEAAEDLLGWTEGKSTDLYKWLVENGFTKANISKELHDRLEEGCLLTENTGHLKWNWSALSEEETNKALAKADRSQMFNAPKEILGKYCGMDTHATYLLYKEVLLPVVKRFKAYESYHKDYFINLVQMLIMQQLGGMEVNLPRLRIYNEDLLNRKEVAKQLFLNHPEVVKYVTEFNLYVVNAIESSQPTQFKKDPYFVTHEPPKFKKDGKLSKTWEVWNKKMQEYVPEVTCQYLKWEEKLAEAQGTNHFNINSDDDCRWLFYEKLKFPVLVTTDSDLPALNGDARKGFGEVGKVYDTYADLEKEQSYVQACINLSVEGESDEEGVGTLHVSHKCPGTVTGRLAGSGGLNLQQVPKVRGYLENYIARPGTKWLVFDFTALEMVVGAALSKDKSLLNLYGPSAKFNDVYLYVASQINGLNKEILACGYDPFNPTKEAIDKAKEECKTQRQTGKVVTLSSNYGAGASKIRASLALDKIYLSNEEAKSIHTNFWKVFAGIKEYTAFLEAQWERNGGWFLNGIGRPLCADERKLKDCYNSNCQSTGHDVLMIYNKMLREELDKREIPYFTIFPDWHDSCMLEVPDEFVASVEYVMNKITLDRLNKLLNNEVLMGGKANVVDNLADDKCDKLTSPK